MFSPKQLQKIFFFSSFLVGVIIVFSLERRSYTLAQSDTAEVRLVRTFELDESNLSYPAGLAYTPRSNAFHIVEARQPGQPRPAGTDLVWLTPLNERVGSAWIAAAI